MASFATGIHLHGSIHDLADSLKSATSNAGPNNSVKVYYDNLVDFIADSIPGETGISIIFHSRLMV